MASTLERVPMGASDLKANAQRMFRKAMIISCAVHLALIGIYLAVKLYKPPDEAAYSGRVIRMETLPPPPPLTDAPPPPVITAPKIAPPTMGVPVPVPDAQAPEQIRGDDLPSEGEFVYYEDAPAPVTQVQPTYPEMAREANVQGRVVLHVLVGKDGRVKNVKVIRSVTMLDQAAVEAVRKWVFKPALSNNKPVAVWVEVPVDFHF
jgi:protein TonB